MIILLVNGLPEERAYFAAPLKKIGISLVLYSNPVKAMDNLEEIKPDAIWFVVEDFPRHWKSMLGQIRQTYGRDECPFILISREHLGEEDIHKAMYLGANGFLKWDELSSSLVHKGVDILSRYMVLPKFTQENQQSITGGSLVFTHPERGSLMSGELLSLEGLFLVFLPGNRYQSFDLEEGEILKDVSLQVGENFTNITLQILKNSGNILCKLEEEDLKKIKNLTEYQQLT